MLDKLSASLLAATRKVVEESAKKAAEEQSKRIAALESRAMKPASSAPAPRNHGERVNVVEAKEATSPKTDKEKKLAALAEPKDKITHADVMTGRGVTKEAWEDMLKSVKDAAKPQPNGGAGVKKGRAYGGANQKDTKEKDVKEEAEQIAELSKTTLKSYVEKGAQSAVDSAVKSSELAGVAAGIRARGDSKVNNDLAARTQKASNQEAGRALKRLTNVGKAHARLGTVHKSFQEEAELNTDTPGNSTHQCAIHVKHSKLGEGRTLFSQHAEPDAQGNIAWYDVMFEHGIEKKVSVEDLDITLSESHMNHKKKGK